MRKPRDYDAELKQLSDRTRDLRNRKLVQLGELVSATAADALPVEVLAGGLLAAVENKDAELREGWRRRGAAFFRDGRAEPNGRSARSNIGGEPEGDDKAQPPTRPSGAE